MKEENKDIIGDNKCVQDENGNLAISEKDKLKTWKSHYDKLLNIEFEWDQISLSEQPLEEGPPTEDMVLAAISKMKSGKAAGPSGIVIEMVWAGGETIISAAITHLVNKLREHTR